ncbi:MAG: hypothetical protein IKR98_02730 [Bacteroidaceae bacterium]|nr:hypothetical protein [Bacteroidaceae bacterium]
MLHLQHLVKKPTDQKYGVEERLTALRLARDSYQFAAWEVWHPEDPKQELHWWQYCVTPDLLLFKPPLVMEH